METMFAELSSLSALTRDFGMKTTFYTKYKEAICSEYYYKDFIFYLFVNEQRFFP